MHNYKAVIDIEGFDMNVYRELGMERIGEIMKRHYESTFVHEYNHFKDLVNPKLEGFNAEYDNLKEVIEQSYEQFIREKYLEVIANDKWMKNASEAGLYEYEIDDECRFVLKLPAHEVRMKVHLEKI